VQRFGSSRIVVALVTVLTALPAVATACTLLCAPAMHMPAAGAGHHGSPACHHASTASPIVGAASDHDCRTHFGAAREVPATLAPQRHDFAAQALSPAIVTAMARVLDPAPAPVPSSHGPPIAALFRLHAPTVLRV
jgi:hypothetical protein